MPTFARENPKEIKPSLGRTATADTPLSIRSRLGISDTFREQIREHLGRALDPFGPRIQRVSVRFEDVNGRRGGVDTLCRIKVAMEADESIIIEELAEDAAVALARAIPRVARNVRRAVERYAEKAPRPATPRRSVAAPARSRTSKVGVTEGRKRENDSSRRVAGRAR
jgi:ribosome-associated translation inhibitor RaiA